MVYLYHKHRLMVRIIIINILLISCSYSSDLQHDIGLKFAVTRSNISGNVTYSNELSIQPRTGFNLALSLDIYHSENIHFMPQIEYSQRGYRIEYAINNPADNYFRIIKSDTRLDFFSFPIFVKFILPGPDFAGSFSAGIRLDHMINEQRATLKTPDSIIQFHENPSLKSTNLGGSLMLGFHIKYSLPFTISLEFRYNFDFGKILPQDNEGIQNTTKSMSTDIWIGVMF